MFTVEPRPEYLSLIFHAPESANAFSLDGARALTRVRKEHARSPLPVVVRSGHPTIFCAGGNLRDHQALRGRHAGLRANREIEKHLDAFARWPVPKLAVIEGRALGGGVEWLARFDVRWATPAAELNFRQKHVGLSFGWGGGAAWARWIGEARIRQLLLEAPALAAAEAYRLGLVDRVIEPTIANHVDRAIEEWARGITSPINAELARWTVATERKTFNKLWWGPAHRAALAAFGRPT